MEYVSCIEEIVYYYRVTVLGSDSIYSVLAGIYREQGPKINFIVSSTVSQTDILLHEILFNSLKLSSITGTTIYFCHINMLNSTLSVLSLYVHHQIAESPSLYEENNDWVRGQFLGSGAFSCCYQARDIGTGALMAVKVVSFVRNSTEEQERVEAAVEDEILLMGRLRHRNLVRLMGSVRYSTSFCVFTEWMAGGSVANMLERYGAFSETVIVRYSRQVLQGLDYLHDNMILHRDLKG